MVDLVEGQVVMDGQGVQEEEEGTLEEAVAISRNSCGGGGGSYNVGKYQQNDCCYRSNGHGQVIITLL